MIQLYVRRKYCLRNETTLRTKDEFGRVFGSPVAHAIRVDIADARV